MLLYIICTISAIILDKSLKMNLKEELESRGLVYKNRFERYKRCTSGNNIDLRISKKDVFNFFKENILYFVPVVNLAFILFFAFSVRGFSYGESYQNRFFSDWINFLISLDMVVPCSEEELDCIRDVENDTKQMVVEKVMKFLNTIGIEIKNTLEEEIEVKPEEKEEVTSSSIEINISTPSGNKKYYHVFDFGIDGNLNSNEEELNRIIESLNHAFERADNMINQAIEQDSGNIEKYFEEIDETFDKMDREIDQTFEEVDQQLDRLAEKVLKL